MLLPTEEYIEQAHFFGVLSQRLPENVPTQDLLEQLREEALSTTRLPMAIDFLLAELKHAGVLSTAMRRLSHYFTPFQSYVFGEAEREQGRFDLRIAVVLLQKEAEYRAREPTRAGLFLYQFEALCRNRLRYDSGLEAIANDPFFDADWRAWILNVRRQIGIVEFADLLFVRSGYYAEYMRRQGREVEALPTILFDEKEGKIALANRRKDPLYLFSALQRQLGYPAVPRPLRGESTADLLPQVLRRLERLETRLKLLEEEQRRGSFDLTRFYRPPQDEAGGLEGGQP